MNDKCDHPLPLWVKTRQTPQAVDHARLCFLIRLAALHHNQTGNISELAEACGLSNAALHMVMRRNKMSGEIAVSIESLLGRETFPRELFRPDLFTLPAE